MKKVILFFALAVLSIALCSCQVNWFTTTVEVPWYVVAVPVALIFVAGYLILMNTTFVCPKCGTEFKPKWYQLSVCVHYMGERIAKCPCCGRKGFCKKKK